MTDLPPITGEQLRDICAAFDREHGTYPEHRYEGLAVYKFLCPRLALPYLFGEVDADGHWRVSQQTIRGKADAAWLDRKAKK